MSISLIEVESRNPNGARRKRYFCPLCQAHGGKTPDLSLDRERGLYHCFKCGAKGLLTEFHTRKEPSRPARRVGSSAVQIQSGNKTGARRAVAEQPWRPVARGWTFAVAETEIAKEISAREIAAKEIAAKEIPAEYVERCRRDFPASPADDYERGRGIDGVKTGMGFDPHYPFLVGDEWVHERGVVFFFQDLEGRVVAKQGRMLRTALPEETAKITFGKISQGVFNVRALQHEEVIVCEGPNTAAALVERGYAAIALGGKTAQDWLLDALVDKKVWIGLDNDEPGRKAADELHERLTDIGCDAELLLPPGEGQDWNDVLRLDPSFRLPWVLPMRHEPTLEDVRAQCRRLLRTARGEARELLEEWEFAIDCGFEAGRAWWRGNWGRLSVVLG